MLERILNILAHWEILAVIGVFFLMIPLITYLSSTERKPPPKPKKKQPKPKPKSTRESSEEVSSEEPEDEE